MSETRYWWQGECHRLLPITRRNLRYWRRHVPRNFLPLRPGADALCFVGGVLTSRHRTALPKFRQL